MKKYAIALGMAIIAVCILLLVHVALANAAGQENSRNPGELHVLMSDGLKAPMEAARAQAEQAIGRRLRIEYGPSLELKPMIEAGAPCDVVLLTPVALDDLIKEGKIAQGSRADIARVPVGVGQRGGASKGDVSTLDALKHTLLQAKSIRYVANGASATAVHKAFVRLGIVEEMKAKTATGAALTPLGPGETELTITLASEILPVKEQTYLGPLPAEVQIPAILSVGVGAHTRDVPGAKALIQFLQGPALDPAMKANGMQRLPVSGAAVR